MASSMYEAFVDYRKSNYHLHRDNDWLFEMMGASTHRQELQVEIEEANT